MLRKWQGNIFNQKYVGRKDIMTTSSSRKSFQLVMKHLYSFIAISQVASGCRHYLLGRRFVIRTDHSALKLLMKMKDLQVQTTWWIESLDLFNFKIQRWPGKRHNNADALSRIPIRKEDPRRMAAAREEQQSQEPSLLKEAQLADP